MTDMSGDRTRYWLGVSGKTEWERMAGTTFAGVYAQMTDAHMSEYGTTREQLFRVAVKNHANRAKNTYAHLRFECSLDDVNSAVVADSLNLYDCCPTSDGASAVILANREIAEELTETSIHLSGSGQASDRDGLFQRSFITSIPSSKAAARGAYKDADITLDEIEFAEVHDCISIAELIAYEDLGFCESGKAGEYIENGAPPEFSDPLDAEGAIGVVLVQLDEGVRDPSMLTDCDPYAVHQGNRVKAVVRRIYKQEGVIRYGRSSSLSISRKRRTSGRTPGSASCFL